MTNNFFRWIILGLFAFILIAGTAHAFPFRGFIESPSNFSLLSGDRMSVPLVIDNVDFRSHDVRIRVDTSSPFIQLKPAFTRVNVSPYEQFRFGVELIATEDARSGTYDAEIILDAEGQITRIPFTVYVGSNPFLIVNPFEKSVCANDYVGTISAEIQNRTGRIVDANISASHPLLMPQVNPPEIRLTGGEREFVSIVLNVAPSQEGDYEGRLFVQTNDIWVQRPFMVNVSDCPAPVIKTISISLPTRVPQLPKLETTFVPITVENLTDVPQDVTLIPISVVAADNVKVQIGPRQKATLQLALTPGKHVEPGRQRVEITGMTSTYSQTVVLEVDVLPLSRLTMEQIEGFTHIRKGEQAFLQLLVVNDGDIDQSVSMMVADAIPGITVTFVPQQFILTKGNSLLVLVGVEAQIDTPVRQVTTFIQAQGSVTATIPLSFMVEPARGPPLEPLQVVSYPIDVSLQQGESRTISISVHNPNSTAVSEVRFTLPGDAREGIFLVPRGAATIIQPLETKTMEVTLFREADSPVTGVVERQLALHSQAGTQRVPLRIHTDAGFTGFLSGLVAFVGERGIWLGGLILILLGIYWLGKRTQGPQPVWVRKGRGEPDAFLISD
ncbi:MAG: hypothetical protein U1C71_04725 [archaeon]|nr:hypothetical protein [archaeon]